VAPFVSLCLWSILWREPLILNPTGFSITPDWTLPAEFRFGHPYADEVEKGCMRQPFSTYHSWIVEALISPQTGPLPHLPDEISPKNPRATAESANPDR
jgi:hypothetical protein